MNFAWERVRWFWKDEADAKRLYSGQQTPWRTMWCPNPTNCWCEHQKTHQWWSSNLTRVFHLSTLRPHAVFVLEKSGSRGPIRFQEIRSTAFQVCWCSQVLQARSWRNLEAMHLPFPPILFFLFLFTLRVIVLFNTLITPSFAADPSLPLDLGIATGAICFWNTKGFGLRMAPKKVEGWGSNSPSKCCEDFKGPSSAIFGSTTSRCVQFFHWASHNVDYICWLTWSKSAGTPNHPESSLTPSRSPKKATLRFTAPGPWRPELSRDRLAAPAGQPLVFTVRNHAALHPVGEAEMVETVPDWQLSDQKNGKRKASWSTTLALSVWIGLV